MHIRPGLIASVLVALVVLASGCDTLEGLLHGAPDEPAHPAQSIEFTVDAHGVYYATQVGPKRLLPADRLSRVAIADRAAVVIQIPGKTPRLSGRHYAAELIDAKSGDKRTARLLSEHEILARLALGRRAANTAIDVRVAAEALTGGRPDAPPVAHEAHRDKHASAAKAPAAKPAGAAGGIALELDDEKAISLFGDARASGDRGRVETETRDGQTIQIRRLNVASAAPVRYGRVAPKRGRAPVPADASWKPVTVYYAKWCGVCHKAMRWLDAHHVPYKAVDVEASKSNAAEMVRFCSRHHASAGSIPTFRIGDAIMQGWNAQRFQQMAML